MAISTAAAVIGSAALSAGASALASSKASKAQKQAATMQQQSEADNLALQRSIFEQQREDQAPWREAGASTLSAMVAGLGPNGDFNRDFTLADFQEDPGYQFRKSEGLGSLGAMLRATGQTESGAAMKEAMRFGDGLASQGYQDAYNRFNADRDRRFNRAASIAGVGQTATNQVGQAAQNFGAQASSAYGRIGEAAANMGNARASSYVGAAQGINNLASGVGNYFALRQFMPQTAAFNPSAAYGSSNASLDSFNAANTFRPFGG